MTRTWFSAGHQTDRSRNFGNWRNRHLEIRQFVTEVKIEVHQIPAHVLARSGVSITSPTRRPRSVHPAELRRGVHGRRSRALPACGRKHGQTRWQGRRCSSSTMASQEREYESVWTFRKLSADGTRFAYAADIGSRDIVVLDGQPGSDYDKIMDVAFSPDGRHFAYLAKSQGECCVVVDGKEGRHFRARRLSKLSFSPDGGSIAFVVQLDSTELVFWKDKPGPEYERIDGDSLAISPDSKHLAYVSADKGGTRVVVVDGKSSATSPSSAELSLSVGRFVFSDAPVWSSRQ